jgi:hypothetical protein
MVHHGAPGLVADAVEAVASAVAAARTGGGGGGAGGGPKAAEAVASRDVPEPDSLGG